MVFLLLSFHTAQAGETPAVTAQTEPPTAKGPEAAGTPTPDTEAAKGRPDPNDTKVSMSFDKADINSVVKFLSVASDVPIVCDSELKGNVTIVSLKQIPLSDAFEVVNSALRVRGFVMVGTLTSKVIRVVSLKKAVADRSVVRSGRDAGDIDLGDNLVTQIIPVRYVSVAKLKDELKPLVSAEEASLVAISSTNTLIVTDNSGNVRRIVEIVQELDKDLSDVIEVKVYPCKYSSADGLVNTLKEIFKTKEEPKAPPPGQPPPQPKPGEAAAAAPSDGLIMLQGEVRISSDPRTNSVIISASHQKIELVMDVIEKIDVDTEPEVQVRSFPLEYADAKLVAEQLNNIYFVIHD
jgi:general secretion pathway protein D